MLKLKYVNTEEYYSVDFEYVNDHILQITGDFPVKTDGFTISRELEDGEMDELGDYSAYTTVYRTIENGAQFSDDGSTYVPPEPTPPPEPYIPTLEEAKFLKINDMNVRQQLAISDGIDITLTDGTVEHFTLTDHDQTSLMGLQTQIAAGIDRIPWHTADHADHCKYYSNEDMQLIVTAAMAYVTWHVTYFRDLRIYIDSLQDKESVEAVVYGMDIPEEYQSEVLKDLIAAKAQAQAGSEM